MANLNLVVLALTAYVAAVHAVDYCYTDKWDTSWNREFIRCDTGCCGDSWNRRCCTQQDLMIGMIVLGVLLVCGIVATIVIIMCCRRRAHRGTVLRQNQAAAVTLPGPQVVTSYNTPMAGYPYAGYTNYAGPQMQVTTMTTTPGAPVAPSYTAGPPPAYESLQQKQDPTAPPQ